MNEVDRELERMFWPPPKRAKTQDGRGLSETLQLLGLATGGRAPSSGGAARVTSGPQPVAGGQLLREELRAHLRRAPQVMVKITGKSRGLAGVRDHLEYIADGKADPHKDREEDERGSDAAKAEAAAKDAGERLVRPVITETGERVETVGGVKDLIKEWQRSPSPMPWTSDKAEAVHVMWQMPPGTDAGKLLAAVQAAARAEFGGHRYALALHQHQSSPHVHMLVRVKSDDGAHRLNPRKADLHRWRMRFAHELRERGVDAAASRQRTRGYAQRHEHLWERKMSEREAALRDRSLRARALGRDVSADDLDARADAVRRTVPTRPRSLDVKAQQQVASARVQWTQLRDALAKSADPADRQLAQSTEAFIRREFARDAAGGRETDQAQRPHRPQRPQEPQGPQGLDKGQAR